MTSGKRGEIISRLREYQNDPAYREFLRILEADIENLRRANDDASLSSVAKNQGGIHALRRLLADLVPDAEKHLGKTYSGAFGD